MLRTEDHRASCQAGKIDMKWLRAVATGTHTGAQGSMSIPVSPAFTLRISLSALNQPRRWGSPEEHGSWSNFRPVDGPQQSDKPRDEE